MVNRFRRYSKRRIISNRFFSNLSFTNRIILLNVILYVIALFLLSQNPSLIEYMALKPDNIFKGKAVWTLLTSVFLHLWFFHLFFNMFSLFFLGNFVERIIGRKRFLWFYISSGVLAGLFFALLAFFFGASDIGGKLFGQPDIVALGASGAIFALLGVLAFLVPRAKVYLIAGPLIAIIIQSILTNIFPENPFMDGLNFLITIYFFIAIFSIFSFNTVFKRISLPIEMPFWILPFIAIIPLIIIGLFVSLPIGNSAHLGGLIVGLIYGAYLRKKYKRKVKMLSRYFG